MSSKKKEKAPQSTGFGESKIFAAPEGSFEQTVDWSKMTVNGEPIPEAYWGLIPYAHTDEGREKFNEGKEMPRVQILSDEVDSSVRHYRDDLRDSIPLIENNDPLRRIVEKYTPAGHRGLMMSEKKCDKEGMQRGVLEYEPVMVMKDGKLERVKHGGMFLGSVPESHAKAAEKYYADKARDRMVDAADRVNEGVHEIVTEQVGRKITRSNRGEFAGVFQEDHDQVAHEFVGASE